LIGAHASGSPHAATRPRRGHLALPIPTRRRRTESLIMQRARQRAIEAVTRAKKRGVAFRFFSLFFAPTARAAVERFSFFCCHPPNAPRCRLSRASKPCPFVPREQSSTCPSARRGCGDGKNSARVPRGSRARWGPWKKKGRGALERQLKSSFILSPSRTPARPPRALCPLSTNSPRRGA